MCQSGSTSILQCNVPRQFLLALMTDLFATSQTAQSWCILAAAHMYPQTELKTSFIEPNSESRPQNNLVSLNSGKVYQGKLELRYQHS